MGQGRIEIAEETVDLDPVQQALAGGHLTGPGACVRVAGQVADRLLGLACEVAGQGGLVGLGGGVRGGERHHACRVQLSEAGGQVGARLVEQMKGLVSTAGAAQRGRGPLGSAAGARRGGPRGRDPVPWDSRKVSGNLRRPRGLQRALFLFAQVSVVPDLEGVLRPEEEGGQRAQASRPCSRPAPRQRPLSHDPRQDTLSSSCPFGGGLNVPAIR
jgi:hypothetical protein